MPVRADVVHERPQLLAREADVLAPHVPHAGVRDRRVDRAGIREGLVVARQHEDELDHRALRMLSDNLRDLAARRSCRQLEGGIDARSDLGGPGRDGPRSVARRHVPARRRAAAGLACGICGTDVRAFFNGDRRIEAPWVLGHEISGELLEIGPDATEVADRHSAGDAVHCISTL